MTFLLIAYALHWTNTSSENINFELGLCDELFQAMDKYFADVIIHVNLLVSLILLFIEVALMVYFCLLFSFFLNIKD